jgi:hypothetical protein
MQGPETIPKDEFRFKTIQLVRGTIFCNITFQILNCFQCYLKPNYFKQQFLSKFRNEKK